MAYPVTSGTPYTPPGASTTANPNPAYSGTFIPEIWSGRLIDKFYDATVLAAIANTDYEGEIRNQGDKVNIRTKPTLTIRDYSANSPLELERPSSSNKTLLIDKGKYFNCILDDVMRVQSDLNQLSMWSDDASEQMKIKIDTAVLNDIYPDIVAANKGNTAGRLVQGLALGTDASPVSLDETNVVDLIVDLGQTLDEQNIPETGRWLIIPAWVASRIKKSDLRDASITGDGSTILRNGRLGMVDRFTIYRSNLLPSGTSMLVSRPSTMASAGRHLILAGHSHGMTFASQMSQMETLRSEITFGTILRGLQVYGYSVLDGTAIVGAIVTPA